MVRGDELNSYVLSSNFTRTLLVKSLVRKSLRKYISRKDVFVMLFNLKSLTKKTATFYLDNEVGQLTDSVKTGGLLEDDLKARLIENKRFVESIFLVFSELEQQFHDVNRPAYAKIIKDFKKNEWAIHLKRLGYNYEK